MKLIDKGDYYEIEGYKPIITYDDCGNPTSVIYCPYIPKFFVDGLAMDSTGRRVDNWTTG